MSRYDWPTDTGRERNDDDPAGRSRFVRRRRIEFDPEGARIAARAAPEIGRAHV